MSVGRDEDAEDEEMDETVENLFFSFMLIVHNDGAQEILFRCVILAQVNVM